MTPETPPAPVAPPPGLFPDTRWTLILSARGDPEARRAAVEAIAERYWQPLYVYARRKGLDAGAAEDAVQACFAGLLASDFLSRLDPGRGRLRSYLRASLDHGLAKAYARDRAQKRGGDALAIPLDGAAAEQALATAPLEAELALDREWAIALVGRAIGRLRAGYASAEGEGRWAAIEPFFRLAPVEAPPSHAEVAARSGIDPALLKAALHRARHRFRAILSTEIGATLEDPGDLELELAHLLRVLGTP